MRPRSPTDTPATSSDHPPPPVAPSNTQVNGRNFRNISGQDEIAAVTALNMLAQASLQNRREEDVIPGTISPGPLDTAFIESDSDSEAGSDVGSIASDGSFLSEIGSTGYLSQ